MKIKFLKETEAPQERATHCGDGCCTWYEYELTWFEKDEEADPEECGRKIDLSGLGYRVDYDIIEYP